MWGYVQQEQTLLGMKHWNSFSSCIEVYGDDALSMILQDTALIINNYYLSSTDIHMSQQKYNRCLLKRNSTTGIIETHHNQLYIT